MYRNISLSFLLIILIASCGGNTQERDINGMHIFPVKDFKNGSWLGKVHYIDEIGNFMGDVAFVQTRDGVALMNRKGELVGETRFISRFNSFWQRVYSSGNSLVEY